MTSFNGYDSKELFDLVSAACRAAYNLGYSGDDMHMATNILVEYATGINLVQAIADYELLIGQQSKQNDAECITEQFEVTTCVQKKQPFTPKELGELFYPHLPAKRINTLLKNAGLQVDRRGYGYGLGWMPTKKGEPYIRGHYLFKNGYMQLHWDKSVIDVIKSYVYNTAH